MENIPFLSQIGAPLLAWYDSGARILPWRSQPTPYRVWVSEIMLQQTRVSAALPYFERFMDALPTLADLASAPQEQLLKLWEGLGYYSRVRNLQKAAQEVVEQLGGQLPQDPLCLQKLPGIGEYTAGAIASIAYGVRVPAVDGNVLRVLSRLLASEANVSDAKVKKQLRQDLWQAMPPQRPGDFNQALMELGAMVCLPNGQPLCPQCSLNHFCRGSALGIAHQLPIKADKAPRRVEPRTLFALVQNGRVLLHQRPEKGLLASLWELPGCPGHLDAAQAVEALAQQGLSCPTPTLLGRHTHIFTHVEWPMVCFLVQCQPFLAPAGWAWVSARQLKQEYTLPSAFRPFADQLPLLD